MNLNSTEKLQQLSLYGVIQLYFLSQPVIFPEAAFELAVGVICILDDHGDRDIYYDRHLWRDREPSQWVQSDIMGTLSEQFGERLGIIPCSADTFAEAAEFARANLLPIEPLWHPEPLQWRRVVESIRLTRTIGALSFGTEMGDVQEPN